ncbi:hypothetical protein SLEP1_g44183 [Rubroshorea leprosula]|uniref:Uncharacterized protein n=1 Tax=Rubroshorea leprosula TaxID=152421 RepID=A0AAV5LGM2_9ROSI|nr:hypothetical protein SLEP1_g44183 [Rubroshorea leprosula]
MLQMFLEIKYIYERKLIHTCALDILHLTAVELSRLNAEEVIESKIVPALFQSIEHGIIEFLKIGKTNPDIMLCPIDEKTLFFFNYAIECRLEKYFHEFVAGEGHVLATLTDDDGNNALHMAAKLGPESYLRNFSGAALQMQKELQWFKEFESVIPECKAWVNRNGETPRQVFSRDHMNLLKEAEAWTKQTATSYIIVGALILTIMFGSAFTIPGGFRDGGSPRLLGKRIFVTFAMFDAISLFAASTSVLTFLGILTFRYTEEVFLKSLPTMLMVGILTLLISIATMMVAFCAAISVLLQEQWWVAFWLVLLAKAKMVHTRATQRESPPRGQGRGQPPSVNPVSHNAPVVAPQHQQTEGVGEHNPQYPNTVPSDLVTAQLNAMQQQFGVFQLVLAQLLARDNPTDPLIHLLNPAPPVPPQPAQQPANSPVRSAAPTASQAQSHIPPQPQNPPQPAASDVSRRLDNLEKLLAENKNPQPQVPPISTSIPAPLNTKITQEPYPPGFRMPLFETYDGTKDPDDHLHAFFSIMQAQNASDALMCKMFPSTLRGNARTWYHTLRPNSINAYAELATSFATKFSSRRLIKKTTPELMRITQREGESLKNYMNRFNDAMLEVNAFDEAVGVTVVMQGLNHDRFRDNLVKNTPTTFDEVNQRSLKFIKAEEYVLSKPQPPKEARTPIWRDESQSRKKFKPTQNRGPIPVPKLDRPSSSTLQTRPTPPSWTSFTIPRSQILMQIKNKMEMRRPHPIQSPAASRDHTRYCDFHQDHGHTTEECKSLKSELESLARKGMLNEYIQNRNLPKFVKEQGQAQGQAQGSRAPNNRDGVGYQQASPPLPPPSRVIHMITAQKRKIDEEDWKNQSVTFTSADFEGVVTPHNDPLVTSVIINNCEYDGPIYEFNNQPVPVEGVLRLNVAFGSGRTYVTPTVRFLVMKMPSSFNLVIGRPTLTEIRAIVSPPHLCMKFPTPMGIATLRGNQEAARHCYMTSVARPKDDPRATPVEEVEKVEEVQLDDNDPSKKTQIGTKLTPIEKEALVGFLKVNKDVFAWTSADMLGIPTSVAVHKLSTNPLRKPVAQKRRLFWGERLTAIKEEVKNLLQVGFIRRVDYCEWIANPVMAASGNERLSLLDAYSGYHQVRMAPEDEKMVTIVFRAQIGRNLEVYVDDIVVKSSQAENHLTDLAETFNNLRRYGMKLNPAKCTFGVESGKFLGFMVSRRGIEVNPEKIKAIEEMKPPRSTKDVQRLAGRVAALHRFISKSADKCLPFFKVLRTAAQKDEARKPQKFNWTTECQVAFDELKAYLGSSPLLTKAQEGEILYLYLGISYTAVSSVLVKEMGKQQQPVYYASKVLQGAEQRYSIAEKAALAVVVTARKLRPYFQSHPIIVMTDQPLRQILQKPKCSRRLIKWAVELGEFQIAFQQRSTIRAQALADFVVECTSNQVEPNSEAETWTLYVDGSSNNKGSGVGAVLTGPDGFRSEHALKFNFQATNNVAEYEALLLGLRLAAELKVKRLQINSDSQLVVNQINSMCEVIDPVLARYVAAVSKLKNRFEKFQLTQIPRAENEHADSLSKLASKNSGEAKSVYIEILNEPSFQTSRVMEISTDLDAPSWTNPIREYLLNGTVPRDKQEEMKLRRKASRYTLVGDILYKRSYSLPLLRCLTPYEAEYALREVHEGVCGNHVGARTLAHKVLRQGYYWLNMQEDAKKFVQRCQKCQFFAHLTHQAAEELTSLTAPWPFAQWGIDLLGPFVKAVGGATHLVVAVDYFTKWVEARPLSCLTLRRIEDFLFSSVICKYGIPNQIIADNGPQFNCNSFRDFCSSYGIKLVFTSVYHPEANGIVESVNKAILEGIKPRLDQLKTKWVDELNNVLWAYQTTSRTATGETPYHLAFGTEAVIHVEIGVPSLTYKQRIANLYNKRVRPRNFIVGDLVLRKAGLIGFETRYGKLAPNWEGPYIVTKVPHLGAYILQDAEGKRVPRVWNVNNLKKFHP